MSNRIINIHDGPNGDQPQQPLGMEDLLNSAEKDWKFKRKDEAFVKVLGAMAMMSQGVAQAMKVAELAMKEVEELEARLANLKQREGPP